MRESLKRLLKEGYEAGAEWDLVKEKARHHWVKQYVAQVVCTGSQVYWTEETEYALEELEGGQEDSVKRHLGVTKDRLAHLIENLLK